MKIRIKIVLLALVMTLGVSSVAGLVTAPIASATDTSWTGCTTTGYGYCPMMHESIHTVVYGGLYTSEVKVTTSMRHWQNCGWPYGYCWDIVSYVGTYAIQSTMTVYFVYWNGDYKVLYVAPVTPVVNSTTYSRLQWDGPLPSGAGSVVVVASAVIDSNANPPPYPMPGMVGYGYWHTLSQRIS